ncbi:MAG: ribosome recycling factor [Nakamurella sp.]
MSEALDMALLDAEEKMEKAFNVTKEDLASIRTGRATPNIFNKLSVEYYGAQTPLPQMATISIPEARMAIIKPYDATQLQAIEKSIRDSDLGINPSNDGNIIRIVFPQLTEERRRELGKQARSRGEDAKVAVRNVRRKAKDDIDKLVKDGDIGEDEGSRAEKDLQHTTDKFVSGIDDLVKHKEAELLEV